MLCFVNFLINFDWLLQTTIATNWIPFWRKSGSSNCTQCTLVSFIKSAILSIYIIRSTDAHLILFEKRCGMQYKDILKVKILWACWTKWLFWNQDKLLKRSAHYSIMSVAFFSWFDKQCHILYHFIGLKSWSL